MPINYRTKRPYSGVNVLLLWLEGMERGFECQEWLTFKQAQEIGAKVRKGAKGCRVVFFKVLEKDGREGEDAPDEKERFPMLRSFVVFNAADIDGLPEVAATTGGFAPDATAEYLMKSSGAEIIEGGARAFYRPATDTVHLPERGRFQNTANFYNVALHELTHNAARRIMPRRSVNPPELRGFWARLVGIIWGIAARAILLMTWLFQPEGARHEQRRNDCPCLWDVQGSP